MTYKQIEASREARLWIGQVIIPAATAAAVILANPETRQKAGEIVNSVKSNIKSRLKKGS